MHVFADPTLLIFGKLALAALMGMLIGTERAMVGKRAGTRTFALVALGSALFVIVSTQVTSEYLGIVNFDPMRVAAGIVAGIGFIGAGLIIFRDDALRGLTTAASLWVAAAVGIAVGYGLYAIALFTTLIVLFIFTVLWRIENLAKSWFESIQPVRVTDDADEDRDGDSIPDSEEKHAMNTI